MKVIRIDGFRGIISALFIGACLFAGFVVFPGYVAMYLWNKYLVSLLEFPVLGLIQGVLLWGIIAVSYALLFKGKIAVSFKSAANELSDRELNMIMKNARIHSNMKNLDDLFSGKDEFIKSKHDEKDLFVKKDDISSITHINSDENDKTISN